MPIVKLSHYFLLYDLKKARMVIMCSGRLEWYFDGERHTAIGVPLVSLLHLPGCLQGSFSDLPEPCDSGIGCVVLKKLAIGRLNIPFTGPDPLFAFAVATLGLHASSARAYK